MKTILVTGGAGYIGSHTVNELIEKGFSVVVLDSMESGHKEVVNPKAKLYVGNINDSEIVKKIFAENKIDAVIDFAAYLAAGESMVEPEMYLENNVINFVKFLDALVENGCKHIIKSSTAAVYGNPTKEDDIPWREEFIEKYRPQLSALLDGKWDGEDVVGETFFDKFITKYEELAEKEELKLSPDEKLKAKISLSIYGLSKLLDEIILKKYDELYGMKSIALRYFNVCGADPEGRTGDSKPVPTNLMTLAIMNLLGKIPELKINGRDYETPDGTCVRDYIHPSDLATGHVAALNYLLESATSDIINLGTGSGSTVLEVIAAVEKASSKKAKTSDGPRRSGDPVISVADPSRAKQVLNWQAKYNIDDMAETAWKWHSQNPYGF